MIGKIKSLFSKDSFVEITKINKTENSIDVEFNTSEDINQYLKEKNLFIEYLKIEEDLTDCPDGICVIPAVANLLPLAWFFDFKLIINELDKNFYESISQIKKGYEKMYPFVEFKGKVIVKNVIDYIYRSYDTSVLLFSQGIDSMNSFVNHADENLHLTTIHGSDIPLDKVEGWNRLASKLDEFANQFGCENSFIKSNFRRCMNYSFLNEILPKPMKDNWWHQFQHGIGIISHAAIIAYVKKSKRIYMASTHSETIAKSLDVDYVRCASSPIIDNNFRFAGCEVIHDGYEYRRIDKLENIINYSKSNKPLKLRVCFTSKDGDNCSMCEKCSRCICGLISFGEDPNDYGFDVDSETLPQINHNLDYLLSGREKKGWRQHNYRSYYWINIQNNFKKSDIDFSDNDEISWILDYDF